MSPIEFGIWTGVCIFLVTPSGRAGCRYLVRLLVPILLAWRYMLWEMPLRAVTGRARADQRKIAAMEHACGIPQSSGRPWLGNCACALCAPAAVPGPAAGIFLPEQSTVVVAPIDPATGLPYGWN